MAVRLSGCHSRNRRDVQRLLGRSKSSVWNSLKITEGKRKRGAVKTLPAKARTSQAGYSYAGGGGRFTERHQTNLVWWWGFKANDNLHLRDDIFVPSRKNIPAETPAIKYTSLEDSAVLQTKASRQTAENLANKISTALSVALYLCGCVCVCSYVGGLLK